MNDCATCGASFDCTDPMALYSLQSVSFPFVPICPAGVTCDIGSDFHLICCQQDIFIQFPPGFDATQKQRVIAGAVAECQRQAAFCPGCENPPCVPCPTPPCVLNLYWNHSETCSVNCPDGTPFSATIVAGTYLATSQIEADTFAFRGACARAKDHRICLSALDEALCADDAASLEIKGSGKYLASGTGSDFWAVIDGEIPTGMTFEGGFRTDRKCVIDGTPTTAGVYTFTVRVTVWTPGAAFGDYTEKSYTVKVVGIAPATLPDATIGTAYSQNLTVSPTHDQETEQWILLTSLPAGLTMTEAGVITGTPTGPSESHDVEVQVEFTLDGKQVTCSKEYTLTVNEDLLILGYWKMEEASGDRLDATGRGSPMHEYSGNVIGNTPGEVGNAALVPNDPIINRFLVTDDTTGLKLTADKGVTITGWFKYVGAIAGAGGGFQVFDVAQYYSMSSVGGYPLILELKMVGIIPTQFFRLLVSDNAGHSATINGPIKNDNLQTFYAFWFDPADGKARLQFDNGTVLVGSTVFTIGSDHAKGNVIGGSNNPAGGAELIGYASEHYSDEMAVWNKVLSASEKTTLYNNYLLGIRPTI